MLCLLVVLHAEAVGARDFVVSTTNDTADANLDDGECLDADLACSLRAAVQQSGHSGGSNRVLLDNDVYRVELRSISLAADNQTTVVGATRSGSIIDGGLDTRPFDVVGVSVLTLQTLTLQNGLSGDDGGVRISNGQVTVTRSTISANTSGSDGGGIRVSDGTTALENSTITGNSAGSRGGGLRHSKGTVTIVSSTIARNDATRGGGISTDSASVTLAGSIVAPNVDDDGVDMDCDTDTGEYLTNGANIDGDDS